MADTAEKISTRIYTQRGETVIACENRGAVRCPHLHQLESRLIEAPTTLQNQKGRDSSPTSWTSYGRATPISRSKSPSPTTGEDDTEKAVESLDGCAYALEGDYEGVGKQLPETHPGVEHTIHECEGIMEHDFQ
ncbi:hypothetical protein PG984_007016 [Apiospora sp. TS-2023a]